MGTNLRLLKNNRLLFANSHVGIVEGATWAPWKASSHWQREYGEPIPWSDGRTIMNNFKSQTPNIINTRQSRHLEYLGLKCSKEDKRRLTTKIDDEVLHRGGCASAFEALHDAPDAWPADEVMCFKRFRSRNAQTLQSD